MDFITVLIFFGILALNAFFCAAETALTAVSESKLQTLATRGSRRANLLIKLLRKRSRVVAGLLVGQNIVGAVLTAYSTIVINGLVPGHWPAWQAAVIAVLISIVLLLVFGEVIPKSLAVHAPTSWAMAVAWPVFIVSLLFRPVTAVLAAISGTMLKIVGGARAEATLTVEEIQAIARMGHAAGAIDEFEGKVIAKAAMLNDIRVREIMIPRTDIQGIEVASPLPEVREFFQKSGYSRIPVYKGDMDDIVGVLNFKEFLRLDPARERGFDVLNFLHKPLFVSQAMFIGDLLNEMRKKHSHMAVALDEYGGTAGLITLEDVIEMLVGRIEDEYDVIAAPVNRIDERTFEFDGRVTDERLMGSLGVELPPEVLEGFDTVAGLALKAFGNIPSEGDTTTYHGLEITATEVKGHRVRRVKVRILTPEEVVASRAAASTRRRTARVFAADAERTQEASKERKQE
jgi:putative hemolysin